MTVTCIHCQRAITPTEFGTWQDADHPGYEVCELSDDNGPSHTPYPTETVVVRPHRSRMITVHDHGMGMPCVLVDNDTDYPVRVTVQEVTETENRNRRGTSK